MQLCNFEERSNFPGPLLEENLKVKDPIQIFRDWYDESRSRVDCAMPNIFCLTTANSKGEPSGRMMTLSSFSKYGFIFLTNAKSRKGTDMSQNKKVNLTFHWIQFLRMVSIDGDVEECPSSIAEENFKNRKAEAKFWANLCNQGTPVKNRVLLEDKEDQLRKKYSDDVSKIPKPDNWKAYLVKPRKFIFWQGHCGDVIQDKIFFYRPKPGSDKKECECAHPGENGWMYYRVQS